MNTDQKNRPDPMQTSRRRGTQLLLLVRDKPWVRVGGTALLLLFATLAHLTVEPLRDKFHT